MSNWKFGNYWNALVDWTEACELIQAKSKTGLDLGTPLSAVFPAANAPEDIEGTWFDWVIAGFLMEECNEVMARSDQAH